MSINKWTDEENVVCTYNGISFSLKKKGSTVICNSMDETGGHKPDTEREILYGITYEWNLKHTHPHTE